MLVDGNGSVVNIVLVCPAFDDKVMSGGRWKKKSADGVTGPVTGPASDQTCWLAKAYDSLP